MCYSPLRIINPSKQLSYRDKLYIEVPCGKCRECRQRRVDDWFVRTYFEAMHTEKLGGRVFFCTFTYSDVNRPKALKPCDNKVSKPEYVYCFSKSEVQKFKKRLAKRLGYGTFRSIITSEYGDEKNLPHHHGLIFYNVRVPDYKVYDIITEIKGAWQGIDDFQVKGPRILDLRNGFAEVELVRPKSRFGAYKYVCKYINKFSWQDFKDLPPECRPFTLVSKGFGSYMMDFYGFSSDINQCKNMQYILDGTIVLPHGELRQLPQYISRKILFDYEYLYKYEITYNPEKDDYDRILKPHVKYTLNHFGEYIRKQRCLHSMEFIENELHKTLDNITLILKSHPLADLNDYLHSDFRSPEDLSNFVHHVLSKPTSYSDLSLYMSVFKDRVCLPYGNDGAFAPFFQELPEKDSLYYLNIDGAKSYLDAVFAPDSAYFDSNSPVHSPVTDYAYFPEVVKIYHRLFNRSRTNKGTSDNRFIDTMTSQMFNRFFPPEFDLIVSVHNYLMYACKRTQDYEKTRQEYLAYQSKLLTPKTI